MAAVKGSYPKGVRKREEILEAALRIIAKDGFGAATLREVAEAVGLTQAGVLHYFGSKEALLLEVVRERDELTAAEFGTPAPGIEAFAVAANLVEHNAQLPGLIRLYTNLAADASNPEHVAHEFFRDRYARTRTLGAEALTALQASGDITAQFDPAALATLFTALLDGLQLLWEYDDRIDMAAHLRLFGRLLTDADRQPGRVA